MLSTTEFNQLIISQSILNNQRARVYFRQNKLPMFGKFVRLSDDDELKAKGFVRFVSAGRIDQFDEANDFRKPSLTALFTVSDIKAINLFLCNPLI